MSLCCWLQPLDVLLDPIGTLSASLNKGGKQCRERSECTIALNSSVDLGVVRGVACSAVHAIAI